tara:strand:+ start:25633 stop:28221 length:2589 start_codon:yes stop_codon:yes gene_type:complete
MATKDFRASQLETSKIIGTGSLAGTSAGIAMYSGSIASNREGGTSDSAMFNNVGSDVFLFVSGNISNNNNSRTNATLFGGDVVVSGTLYAERQVIEVDSVADGDFFVTGNMYVEPDTNSDESAVFRKADGTDVLKVNTNSPNVNINGDLILTGNIHMLSDNFDGVNIETENTFELKAQNNIVMKLDSDSDNSGNGSYFGIRDGGGNYKLIVYENAATTVNFDMSPTTDFVVKGDTNHSLIFVDASEEAVALGRFLSTDFGTQSGVGTDVKILLSGSGGSRGGSTRGVTLAAGDLVTSGSSVLLSGVDVTGEARVNGNLFVTGNIRMQSDNLDGIKIEAENNFDINAQGSIILTIDGDSDSSGSRFFGVRDGSGTYSIVAYEQGDVVINNSLLATNDFFVKGDTDHSLVFVDASKDAVALGRFLSTDFGSEPGVGNDVKVLLSGTVGSRGTSTRGTILNAGDLVVSGASYFSGDVTLEEGASLITPSGIAHKSDTNTNITFNNDRIRLIANNATNVDISSTQVLVIPGGDSTSSETSGADISFYVSGSSGSKGTSERGTSVFGGDLVVSGNIFDGAGNSVGGITIDNDVNNRILTAKGATNNINGEANLLFTGNILQANAFITASNGLQVQYAKTSTVGVTVGNSTDSPPVVLNSVFDADIRYETPANTYGTDVGVLISGSAGSKGVTASKSVTLVSGDLVVSGNIYDKTNKSVFKDVNRGGARLNLSNTTEQFLSTTSGTEGSISSGDNFIFVCPFSGSFDKLTVRGSFNTALSSVGNLLAKLYIFADEADASTPASAYSVEHVLVSDANVNANKNINFNFSGSNYNPTDAFIISLTPQGNWNAGGTCQFNWVSVNSFLYET